MPVTVTAMRSGLASAAAALVAGAGLSVVPTSGASAEVDPGMSVAPMPVAAVSLAQAGEVAMWGPSGQESPPASLAETAVSQVAMADSVTLALTAAGRVVSWGTNDSRLQQIPDAVHATPVAQVATNASTYAGVVTRAGQVLTWGQKSQRPTPLAVPAGLTGVKQLALTYQNAVALKNDGSVVSWGDPDAGLNAPPSGLEATAIATGMEAAYALTEQGTVRAWGTNGFGELDLPAPVRQPDNVKAIAAFSYGAIALLADNTLVGWGGSYRPPNELPAWLSALEPVSIAGNNDYLAMVDRDGVLHHWYSGGLGEMPPPAELNGRAVAQLAVGADGGTGAVVITKMLRGDDPQISGTATVGSTLTATAGTFSASPTTVTGQWLADGEPIAGATGATLPLTAAQLGKKLTYRSTATKAGETTISSTSAAVTVTEAASPPVPPAPTPPLLAAVDSTTKVVKVQVAKRAARVTVTGQVTAAKPVTGKAEVTFTKGRKTIVARTVTVSARGAVTLTVKKFGKLAIKKTKGKQKHGYRGAYTVTIHYAGNSQVEASTASRTFKVR